MRKTVSIFALTLLCLAVLDLAVAGVLNWVETRGRLSSVVQYFEYGRSVPGKHARWERDPSVRGNLSAVAWWDDILTQSAEGFAAAPDTPAVRVYGMSFSGNIMNAVHTIAPEITVDHHAGPAAPPNFTYALFQDDQPNRRPGDVVVLTILSSSVPGMAALSNRTWSFEQPAPFTYPIFRPDEADGLRRIDPLIQSQADEARLSSDPTLAQAWRDQLKTEDAFYGPTSFGLTTLDHSPFSRLVRRSLATGHVARTKAQVQSGGYPYEEVLKRMTRDFARSAEADGQRPVVLLVQTRTRGDVDLHALLVPFLQAENIPYFATADHANPRNQSAFQPDGHYQPEVDAQFADAILPLIRP
ncbi:MAG: hypothetical protein ABJ370_22595 [Paracoccaceae bacterium]